MATWVIGDVHGCHRSLMALLEEIGLDERHDRLWLVGDLVNRGPESLAVLRWAHERARAMADRFVVVLGNHDLHLLAVAAGISRHRPLDTLGPVLSADDRDELLTWLRRRPLLHREDGRLLVHAGLHPAWTWETAAARARAVESVLASPKADFLLERQPPADAEKRRLHEDLAVFTRLRACTETGEPSSWSGPPEAVPAGTRPWFGWPGRWRGEGPVVFGHWAALGFYQGDGVTCLDSGCVWGRGLSALRLEDGRRRHVPTLEPFDALPIGRGD